MSHFELNEGRLSPVLILGIDPGTTGTKIAFLKAYEVNDGDKIDFIVEPGDRIHMLSQFPGYRQSTVSTLPTSMIYKDTGTLLKWGHEAVNFQARHVVDPRYLITNWKLKLLEGSRQGLPEAASQRLRKPCGGFATDFFSAIANYLFNEPTSCLLNHFGINGNIRRQFNFVDVAVAMPPGWTHQEHSIFSDAAKKGLAAIPNVRVITVSETECALRSWMSEQGRGLHMADGDVVILLDLGGGTACLSAFYYSEATKAWVHVESYSLRAGSELVTAEFEHDFLKRFKETELHGEMKALYKARQQFDSIKMGIGEDDEPEFWYCQVEGLLRDEDEHFQDGLMRFSSEQLRSYFKPLQDDIFTKLLEMVTRLRQFRMIPKYCVLAGAYARNVMFLKRFHEANDRYLKLQVFQPQSPAELVATGACRTRIVGDCRLAFGSRISVGIMTFMKWIAVKKECPDAYQFHLEGEGRTLWCRVITWVIKKGDDADPEKAIIDHDGTMLRRRHIQIQDNIMFNETIFTSEAHPGDDQYTVLMYGTDDCGRRNKQHFMEKHGVALNIHEFTLDLTDKSVIQKDGSVVAMKSSSFKRNHAGKYFEYKYYMNLSQTDCRLSLEAFSATGKTRRMLLQYSIPAFEVESVELQDEHRFAEQFSRGAGAEKSQPQCLDIDPDAVVAKSLRLGNDENFPSPPDIHTLRTNEDDSRPIHDLAFDPDREGNIYQQSQQENFSTSRLLRNTGPFMARSNERLSDNSIPTMNRVLDSPTDLLDVATATKAMNNVMAARSGAPEHQQQQQEQVKSSSEAQSDPVRKLARGRNSTRGESENFSGLIHTSNPSASGRRTPDTIHPIEESDDSDYQPTKKPTKKHATPSLKDPVTKQNRSSGRIRKNKHRLARRSS